MTETTSTQSRTTSPPASDADAPVCSRDSFFEAVYALVERIPSGHVTTYGWLARRLQRPQHARLVGYALHGVVQSRGLPCHRVVNSQGRLSGAPHFPWPGQQAMLEAEGVVFKPDGGIDLRRFQWRPVEQAWDSTAAQT
jgi:methylated-DNA-protein-cysteine methyltransferase-like protein